MLRRTTLRTAAGGLPFALADCLSTAGMGTPPTADGELETFSPSGTVDTATIGDRSASEMEDHELQLWNNASPEVTVAVELGTGSSTLFDEPVTIPPGSQFVLEITVPGSYTASIAVGGGPRTQLSIPENTFDCNSSHTQVELLASEINSRVVSSLKGCG